MARDVLTAKLDIIFKKLFTDNLDLLYDFLSGILDIPIEELSNLVLTNTELSPESADAKFSRLDLSIRVSGKLINVEIQVNSDRYFCDRALFYWAKLFTSELKSAERYDTLKPTITINILDFILFPERADYHAEVVGKFNDTNEIFGDKLHIHFFELRKLKRAFDPKNRRELWLSFINADSEEDFDMILQTNDSVMNKAVNAMYDMSEDTRIRENARIREKALHDEASLLYNARVEGRAEGVAAGKAEREAEIAEQMKLFGLTDEQIAAIIKGKSN